MKRISRDKIQERVETLKKLYTEGTNSDIIVKKVSEEYYNFMKRNANKFECLKFNFRGDINE